MTHQQTCLVTGAAGLIGSHLTERLLEAGYHVVAVDNLNDYYDVHQKRSNIAGFRNDSRVTFSEIDIRDREAIDELFATHRPVSVAHLAAMANVRYSIGR
ncbi:MAG: SDR family NAD(P)-dependent oxidoreductase, partial [Algisphaera sp.]